MNINNEKQIEEMAQDICSFCVKTNGEETCQGDKSSYCFRKRLEEATYAFDLGYRKINENEIVISREEYDDLIESKRQLGCYIEDQKIWIDAANGTSKETAEKAFKIVKNIIDKKYAIETPSTQVTLSNIIDQIKEQFIKQLFNINLEDKSE